MGKQFRQDIEGLRAIAVLSVVMFHFGIEALPGGFVGVDVFFVISGYLISGLLLTELQRTGSIDLLRFYGRRARRLLPIALLVLAVTLVVAVLILSPSEQTFAAKGALASSLYASNLYFMSLLADYFAPESAVNPFLHTWSLSVEEQFYFLWPTLLLVLWRWRPNERAIAIAIGALTALSLALCVWLSYVKQDWAFYLSPTRGWEFGLGALAVLRPVTDWARRSPAAVPLGWLGVAALCATFLFLTEDMRFPGWIATAPALATVAILISGASGKTSSPAALLNLPLMQWIGQRSYSIYLWHWPIIVYATILEVTDPLAKVVICSVLTLACAAAGFRLLEHPLRASEWLAAQPLRSVGLGLTATVLGGALALSTAQAARDSSMQPSHAELVRLMNELSTASSAPKKCLIDLRDAQPLKCSFGASNPSRTVVLFGDSHADQWSTPLAQLATEQGWRLVTLLKASCPVSSITDYSTRMQRDWPECTQWRARSIAEIRRMRPDMVIVSQFSSGYIHGPWSNRRQHAVTYDAWEDGLRQSLQELQAIGVPVALLRDSPSPNKHIANCVARSRWRGLAESQCDTLRVNALDPKLTRLESDVAASMGIWFIDLSDRICDSTVCPALKSGTLVYRDANHLTTSFAARQTAALQQALLPTGQMSYAN